MSLASEQVTGPVAIWVAVPLLAVTPGTQSQQAGNSTPATVTATSTPLFFGWGETAPEPEFLPEYEPVLSDLRGSRKAHDKLYEGCDARVTVTMTIWDELVLQAMKSYVKTSQPGTDAPGDIGTLMHAEKRSYQLWLAYTYGRSMQSPKSFMTAAGMMNGYHFYGAMLDGPQRRQQGTKVNKLLLSWFCGSPIVTSFGLVSSVFYRCWDNDMSAVIGKPTNINRP